MGINFPLGWHSIQFYVNGKFGRGEGLFVVVCVYGGPSASEKGAIMYKSIINSFRRLKLVQRQIIDLDVKYFYCVLQAYQRCYFVPLLSSMFYGQYKCKRVAR